MGLYGEHVLPRLINSACGMKTLVPLRSQVCEDLHGRVVELGFGSGRPSLQRVLALVSGERP
jgi:hypothetical protein